MPYEFVGKWTYPTLIYVGPGKFASLAEHVVSLGMKRPLLVTDRGLANQSMIVTAMQRLIASGLEAGLFSDVQGNPTDKNLAAGIDAFRRGGHDGVIVIGGGSAMDVGKLVALMEGQTIPVWDLEDIGDWWTRADASAIHPILAVPTTAGTGSEVGRAAVLTNTTDHTKRIIFHPKMLPSLVIGDPELAIALPSSLTAATGMDALTHSFEAFCVESFHPLADGIALESLRLIHEYLPRAVENGRDLEARTMMFAAALMGGTAFQKGLGAVHSIAHPLGALRDVQHGLANGVLLPYVAAFNRPVIEPKVERIAHMLRIDNGFDGFQNWLIDLRAKIGIPHTLAEVGARLEDADEIAEKAMADPSTSANPRKMNVSEFRKLYVAAVTGDLAAVTTREAA
ncbi:MAG: iron-containing alcohol dehydrogenase [Rhizobiaceae bacterium]|nr:iron-containing alcohol dehydrogenase [Rhizobiaceae bacterium]